MDVDTSKQSTIKFATLSSSNLPCYAIDDKAGNILHVLDAPLIRLLSERLGAAYEVLTPPEGGFGAELPDGNWSGIIGMVKRSEADLAMGSIALTEARNRIVNYSYPFYQSTLSFMTDKPKPMSKKLAIFLPFSYGIWIALMLSLITMAFMLYVLMKRKHGYHKVLLAVLGNLLEQSYDLEVQKTTLKMVALSWFLGVFIITNSYKGLLLSFLTFPTMTGIRDKADLYRAVMTDSVKCYTYKGGYVARSFMESEDASRKAIGKCLKQTDNVPGDMERNFLDSPFAKVFLGGRVFLLPYERGYFITYDSFQDEIYGIPFSKNFCCPKYLNTIIWRSQAAGILEKFFKDEIFFLQLKQEPFKSSQSETSHSISFDDISGAFYILISGWGLSFVIFIAEKISMKRSS